MTAPERNAMTTATRPLTETTRQQPVPVFGDDTADTLGKRVFEVEKEAYPHVLKQLAAGRIQLEGNRVKFLKAQRGERSRSERRSEYFRCRCIRI